MTVAFFALLAALSARADEPFKPYIDCIAAVMGCSAGSAAGFRAGVVDLVLLTGTRAGQDGFYVFAPEDAYFKALPPPPAPAAPEKAPPPPTLWNLYGLVTKLMSKEPPKSDPYAHYKLEAGIHEAVFLSFHYQAPGGWGLEWARPDAGPGGTVFMPAGASGECKADAESRALISREALLRVQSVFATYSASPEPAKDDVINEVNIAGHAPAHGEFHNREQCRKGLEACLGADELKSAATAELAKFK
jgi:hypothetical protein